VFPLWIRHCLSLTKIVIFVGYKMVAATIHKKAVLSQGNRAMPQLFFSV